MNLEKEVYELLKKHFPNHSVRTKPKVEGFSGFVWTPDSVMEKDKHVVAIIECKEIRSKKLSTFYTQMRLAFAELSDLHRKYRESVTLVILPTYDDRAEKYQCLFDSLNGAIVTKKAIIDRTLEGWLQDKSRQLS